MTWNYRIVKCTNLNNGEVEYSIYEAYYNDAGEIFTITDAAVEPFGETPEELIGRSHHGRRAMLQEVVPAINLRCGATRFDKARKAAEVDFQCRDIRAQTATDTDDLARSQQLLGHKTRAMTEHYTRNRKGEKVEPLK